MSRRAPPRTFTVLDKTELTPNMLRITLGGEAMNDFPADQPSAYVKLHLTDPTRERPLLRTYTIRAQRPDSVDIDFVRHSDDGPAARWAEHAQAGDTIDLSGPGPKKRVDASADWVLLVGDMTALPAVSANLEQLPEDTRGHAVIEVLDESDIQTLTAPAQVDLHWVINPQPGENSDTLYNAVCALDWLEGRAAIWCACEFQAMRRLRQYFKQDRDVAREDMYISSYWQHGANEESHKQAKSEDAERAG
ncbi:Siderophore-interacting protein [Salinisphaera shabanensis T35B1]|uniref:siderophore-interacting protein n=1 Tax=Salinisphaera shabanensis TaxID=180542 RepID=UPI00333F8D88